MLISKGATSSTQLRDADNKVLPQLVDDNLLRPSGVFTAYTVINNSLT